VASDTNGHALAQQFSMCEILTSLKENSVCFFKFFQLQGFSRAPNLSEDVKAVIYKRARFAFIYFPTSELLKALTFIRKRL